jgi:hypothetical protein
MNAVRLTHPTVLVLVAVVAAGAFAAGRSVSVDSTSSFSPSAPSPAAMPTETADLPMDTAANDEPLPPGHPPTMGAGVGAMGALPPGHPPVDSMDPTGGPMAALDVPPAAPSPLEWLVPGRWQVAANTSPFRLATYRIPRAAGDPEDAELSVTRAGGSVDANAQRWIGQFDAAGQKAAKRTTRKVGAVEVTTIEVQGNYSGGMGKDPSPRSGWALLGAIVSTPDMPQFFKLTGPAKSVSAAHAEFDAMIGSLAPR